MSTTQVVLPLSSYNEDSNLDLSVEFEPTLDQTIGTHIQNAVALSKPYSSNGDLEFSTDFSPETLARINASSSFHGGRAWCGIPQQWQGLACVPVKEPEVVGFRMGVNTYLSVSDICLGRAEYLPDKEEGMEVGSALGTPDEAFWIKITTRQPAPGTEWEFESRVGCVGRGKFEDISAWGGSGERSFERLKCPGGGRERKEVAVGRLKSVLAHLEA